MCRIPLALWLPLVFLVSVGHARADLSGIDIPGMRAPTIRPGGFLFGPRSLPNTTPPTPARNGGWASPAGSGATQASMPAMTLGMPPGEQCKLAVRAAEQRSGIPAGLMGAIAVVESGRADGRGGVTPWPWSINAEGTDHVYESKAEAIAGVRALQAQGVRSIDVGCMQINLMWHPAAFASLNQGFDPVANANYAARFLLDLYAQGGSWARATALYHSATPELGAAYQRRVSAAMNDNQRRLAMGEPGSAPASAVPARSLPGGGPLANGSAATLPRTADAASGAVYGSGAVMLGNRAEVAQILPGTGGPQRGLDAYRLHPIPVTGAAVRSGAGAVALRAPS